MPTICTETSNVYPALAQLRLGPADWQALMQQGFVSAESRGDRRYWKLRFRRGGRQQVRYVGGEDLACRVQQELDQLQQARQARRQLQQINKLAKRYLREAKQASESSLQAHGYQFHGFSLRKAR